MILQEIEDITLKNESDIYSLKNITIPMIQSNLEDIAIFDDSSFSDDREQLQDMINKASIKGNTVLLKPNHTYIINSRNPNDIYNLITLKPNTKINGNGATIKIGDNVNKLIEGEKPPYIFTFNNLFGTSETLTSNNGVMTYSNINFDLNGANNLIRSEYKKNNCAIFIDKFEKVTIENCTYQNCPGNQVVWLINPQPKSSVIYKNNTIKNVADCITNNYNYDHSSVFIVSEYAKIEYNTFENDTLPNNACAIEVHCKYSFTQHNTFINYTHGVYPAAHSADLKTNINIETAYISNNDFINISAPLVLWTVANDGGLPTYIGTVKFNDNKVYCTGGSSFINCNTLLLGGEVGRVEIINNDIIVDGKQGGSVINAGEKVKTLIVRGNSFKNSYDLVLYSKAINNVIEDNQIIDCSQGESQNAVLWIDGSIDVLKIKSNYIKQSLTYAINAIKLTNSIKNGEIEDNNIIGFGANQIKFIVGNATLDTNKCIVRITADGEYYSSVYGSPGSEYINSSNGNKYCIKGSLFSNTWVNDLKNSNFTFDTGMLPDAFEIGVSSTIVNGDLLLPSTKKQGILKVEKLSDLINFRKFIVQWFYPANNGIDLPLIYFRKANAATNDWSTWYKITGI